MTWQTRIGPAAYTSPGGTRLTFQYENVSRQVNKKTTNYEFPDVDGSFIQDLGNDGRKYPIRAFFSGPDYDLAAAEFEGALLERGRGLLEHPFYGSFQVVPFGGISRRDDLKTAANQAVIEVTFWETIGLVYPEPLEDQRAAAQFAIEAFVSAAAGQFELSIDLESVTEQAGFIQTIQSVTAQAAEFIGEGVERFNEIRDSINNSIDILIRNPLAIATSVIQLVQSGVAFVRSIGARLSAYRDLALSLIGANDEGDSGQPRNANELVTMDLAALAAVSGSVITVINSQFETQPQAIEAAAELIEQLDTVVTWRDDQYNRFDLVDTGASYQQLQIAVTTAANYLIEQSFTLLQERRIILDRERTIIDVSAELYGQVNDDTINFLINTNELVGSDILELKRGRAIVYYV